MKTNKNTKKVTKENKSEMGMNRNEFFEYKKQRCMDLARKGATVGEIAKDLAMTEKEMYAFLSRNFGGVKKMREFSNAGFGIPQVQFAAMSVPTSEKKSNKKQNNNNGNNQNNTSILTAFSSALEVEKNKIVKEFRDEVTKEYNSIKSELELSLSQLRTELVSNFKNSIVNDLSVMAKSL